MLEQASNQIRILGTGTSTGVPTIGCDCPVCTSTNARNKRLRTSALIHSKSGKNFLIDTGPDLRAQLLQNSIKSINATFITHTHADHVHGIDDLRPFCFVLKDNIPIYTHKEAQEELKERFPYIFMKEKIFTKNKPVLGGGIPLLELMPTEIGEKQKILGEEFEFYIVPHGHFKTMIIIHEKMAYLTDISEIPEEVLQILKKKKLEVLIIDCLRKRPHQTHLHLDKTLDYILQIKPKFAGLIHFSHELEHQEIEDEMKKIKEVQIRPLFDGEILNYT